MRNVFSWAYLLIIIMAIFLCGCRTISSRYELINGIMTEVERMEIRGVGQNEADFDKKKISNDSGIAIKIPDINIEDFKTN